VSELADQLTRLSPQKRALLEAELRRRRAGHPREPALVRRPAGQPPTLSLAQRQLWLLDQMMPGSSAYNATFTMTIEGELEPDLLHRALDTIVQRHEALRTVARLSTAGRPEAVLLEGTGVRWEQVDLTDDRATLDGLLDGAAKEPFDLARDVFLRARLFRLGPAEYVLILVVHHIASDGWSRGILFSELSELYNAYRRGEEPHLADLPVQYGDFALWQEGLFDEARFAREAAFWREQLAGANVVLDLPTDHPRPARPSHRGGRTGLTLPEETNNLLRRVGRDERATLFMTLMAATGVFLLALTSQDDIVLGSPVANRLRPELEGLIGFFVNTVIFRVRLGGDPSFRQLVGRARAATIDSLAHQELPFDKLVELLRPKRYPGRNPLFQVNYRMQGVAPPTPRLDGAKTNRVITDVGASRFDLGIGFVDAPGPLRGYLEYSYDLIDPTTAVAWAGAMTTVLTAVAAGPGTPLSHIVGLARAALASEQRA